MPTNPREQVRRLASELAMDSNVLDLRMRRGDEYSAAVLLADAEHVHRVSCELLSAAQSLLELERQPQDHGAADAAVTERVRS